MDNIPNKDTLQDIEDLRNLIRIQLAEGKARYVFGDTSISVCETGGEPNINLVPVCGNQRHASGLEILSPERLAQYCSAMQEFIQQKLNANLAKGIKL